MSGVFPAVQQNGMAILFCHTVFCCIINSFSKMQNDIIYSFILFVSKIWKFQKVQRYYSNFTKPSIFRVCYNISRKNEKNHSNLIYSRKFLNTQKKDAAVPGCTRHSVNYCFSSCRRH